VFQSSSRAGARLQLASVGLVLILAACGGTAGQAATSANDTANDSAGDTASVEPAGQDAIATVLTEEGGLCEMLPLDQVEIALGTPAVSAEASKSSLGLGHSCRITANEETVLDVNRSEKETLDEFKEMFETVGLTDETVEGLGAFAYRAAGTALGGPGARLAVYTGERHIGVTVYAEGDQVTMFEAAEEIARSLLEQGL